MDTKDQRRPHSAIALAAPTLCSPGLFIATPRVLLLPVSSSQSHHCRRALSPIALFTTTVDSAIDAPSCTEAMQTRKHRCISPSSNSHTSSPGRGITPTLEFGEIFGLRDWKNKPMAFSKPGPCLFTRRRSSAAAISCLYPSTRGPGACPPWPQDRHASAKTAVWGSIAPVSQMLVTLHKVSVSTWDNLDRITQHPSTPSLIE